MKAASTNTANAVKSTVSTSIEDIPFQAASVDIWEKKYRLQSKNGEIVDETIDDTYRRVAQALADVEQTEAKRQKPVPSQILT